MLNPSGSRKLTDNLEREVDLFGRYVAGRLPIEELEALADAMWRVDAADRRFVRGALSEPPNATSFTAPEEMTRILDYLRQRLLERGPLTIEDRQRADMFGERIAICYCLNATVPRRERLLDAQQLLCELSYGQSPATLQTRLMWLSQITYRLVDEFGFGETPSEKATIGLARTATLLMAPFSKSPAEFHVILRQFCELTLRLNIPRKAEPGRAAWEADQWHAIERFRVVRIPPNDLGVFDEDRLVDGELDEMAERDAAIVCSLVGAAIVQDQQKLAKAAAPLLESSPALDVKLRDLENLQELILTLVAIARVHAARGRGVDVQLRETLGALRAIDIQRMSDRAHTEKMDFNVHLKDIAQWTALIASNDRSPEHRARVDAMRVKLATYEPPPVAIDPCLVEQWLDEVLMSSGTGRRGLALSGGGFRAACFHVGVMACLADHDLLRQMNMLSCVSGGSIAGAAYAVRLKALLAGKHDLEITSDDYKEVVTDLVGVFTEVTGMNLRAVAFRSPLAMLRLWLARDYTFTERIADLIDQHLFAPLIRSHPDFVDVKPKDLATLARSGKGQTRPSSSVLERLQKERPIGWPIAMWDLGRPPRCEPTDFELSSKRNDLRHSKCPELFVNTTLLNTGGPFLFSTSANGEPMRAVRRHISKMPTLKWLSYGDINAGGDLDPTTYRLSRAVSASAAVPGLLPPMLFRRTHQKTLIALVDGGVCDNQGFNVLVDRGCGWILASDAAAQLSFKSFPEVASFKVIASSTDFLMERVREMSYEAAYGLAQRNPNLKFMTLHLTRGLADPPPFATFDIDQSLANRRQQARMVTADTGFGVSSSCQMLLANVRTDLDCFTEIEVMSLMADGYLQTAQQLRNAGDIALEPGRAWAFRVIEPALANFDPKSRVGRVLGAARFRFLRLPLLLGQSLAASTVGQAALVVTAGALSAAAAALLLQAWSQLGAPWFHRILQGLFMYTLVLLLVHVLPPTGGKRWLWKLLSLPYLLLAMFHAWAVVGVADPIYRRLGRLRN